jgi:hypothetical protein
MTTILADLGGRPGPADGFIVGAWVVALVLVPSVLAMGAAAMLAWRQRGSRGSILARVMSVGLVVACPVVAVAQVARTPGGAVARPVGGLLLSVVFAAEIGGYLWLVLRRPGPLGAWRYGGVFGSVGALAVAVVVFRAYQQHAPFGSVVITRPVMVAAAVALIGAGGLAVLVRRGGIGQRLRQGAVECLWGVLLIPLSLFSADVLTVQDDLGHAVIVLTGTSVFFGLVVLTILRELRGGFVPVGLGRPVRGR